MDSADPSVTSENYSRVITQPECSTFTGFLTRYQTIEGVKVKIYTLIQSILYNCGRKG